MAKPGLPLAHTALLSPQPVALALAVGMDTRRRKQFGWLAVLGMRLHSRAISGSRTTTAQRISNAQAATSASGPKHSRALVDAERAATALSTAAALRTGWNLLGAKISSRQLYARLGRCVCFLCESVCVCLGGRTRGVAAKKEIPPPPLSRLPCECSCYSLHFAHFVP